MIRKASLLGLGMMGLFSTTTPAFADGATQPYPTCANKVVSASESEAAHNLYIGARLEYDEADYDKAVIHFRQAYALDCTKHELLIIISSAYQLKGDKREALAALETYVARVPNSPQLGTYQQKIENLKAGIKADAASRAPAPPPAAAPAVEPRGHSPYPWIVVGVGGAATAAGLVLALTAPKRPSNCHADTLMCDPVPGKTDADLEADSDTASRAKNQPVIGYAIFGGGLALVAGGLLWHFLEPTGPRPSKARVTPSVGPGFAGMTVGGAF